MTPHKTLRPWIPCQPDGPVSIVTSVTPAIYKRVHIPDVIWSIKKIEYCVHGMMKEATIANSEH